MKYINLKNKLKELAKELRELKSHRKLDNRGDWSLYKLECEIDKDKFVARHTHIAYCLLRGRKYEEIERPAADNEPDWEVIEAIKAEYKDEEEDVCTRS